MATAVRSGWALVVLLLILGAVCEGAGLGRHAEVGAPDSTDPAFIDAVELRRGLLRDARAVELVHRALAAFAEDADAIRLIVIDDASEDADRVWARPRGHPNRQCLLTQSVTAKAPLRFEGDLADTAALVAFLGSAFGRDRLADGTEAPIAAARRRLADSKYKLAPGDACERVDAATLTAERFFIDYVARNKPVILTGAAAGWPALSKWTNAFLRERFTGTTVHIKLTPSGEFEGCEDMSAWAPADGFVVPEAVRKQLVVADKVVVRPAGVDMDFSAFMDLMSGTVHNVSAYMEYTSMSSYMPELLADVDLFSFARFLKQEHLNIWIGNGKTLGKLHFDPFENLLCMVAGEKHLTLFPPDANEQLYEGHIVEARLSYSMATHTFARNELLESTAMVMSPVDIRRPDYGRFPAFAGARSVQCTIKEGDALFLPAFWWHEVQSRPDRGSRNIAVNWWFSPLWDKEFPCAECRPFLSRNYDEMISVTALAL